MMSLVCSGHMTNGASSKIGGKFMIVSPWRHALVDISWVILWFQPNGLFISNTMG